MRKIVFFLTAAAMAASIIASVFAGGHACSMSTDECIKKMHESYQKSGWLGIEKEKAEGGARITAVLPNSPAAAAGFEVGDVLVAMNGVAFNDPDAAKLKKAKSGIGPGSVVTYTVRRGGSTLTLTATLATPPESVVAQWLGEHIIKEHLPHIVAAK